MKSKNCNYRYEYDVFGRLISCNDDISRISIKYDYDKYGRCTEKESEIFHYVYKYDENGRIDYVEESKSGVWIKILYDRTGKEIQKTFSNGNSIHTGYDSAGNVESVEIRNSSGIE